MASMTGARCSNEGRAAVTAADRVRCDLAPPKQRAGRIRCRSIPVRCRGIGVPGPLPVCRDAAALHAVEGVEADLMRSLSLWQPWASAMALGLKHIETRHWTTAYRGQIAIHAAKRWARDERERWDAECNFNTTLPKAIPLGAVVAIASLVDVISTDVLIREGMICPAEAEWGNYGPGRYGWIFHEIIALKTPIPFKGAQGFFNVPDELLKPKP